MDATPLHRVPSGTPGSRAGVRVRKAENSILLAWKSGISDPRALQIPHKCQTITAPFLRVSWVRGSLFLPWKLPGSWCPQNATGVSTERFRTICPFAAWLEPGRYIFSTAEKGKCVFSLKIFTQREIKTSQKLFSYFPNIRTRF